MECAEVESFGILNVWLVRGKEWQAEHVFNTSLPLIYQAGFFNGVLMETPFFFGFILS